MVSVPSFRIATDSLQASTFESFLGVRVSLLGGQPEPTHRLGVIAGHTLAFLVHDPEIELSVRDALLGMNPEPLERCCVIASVVCRQGFVECRCGGRYRLLLRCRAI